MTAEALLRRGLERRGDDFILTLDAAFQGLPGTAHGGSVLAVFHALAGGGAHAVRGLYRRRVSLGVPLHLTTTSRDGALDCRLVDAADPNAVLVEGRVEGDGATGPAPQPAFDVSGHPLPISLSCFACGKDNPLGLRVQLRFDDASVGGMWTPRATLAAEGGVLAPVALTALLDEAAFWLGALASGESGMTTELAVRLHASVPFGMPVLVGGRRPRVCQRADDPRYWDTEVAVWTADGQCVADARITFVAVRGAARRLVAGMLSINPPEVVRRIFPAYAN